MTVEMDSRWGVEVQTHGVAAVDANRVYFPAVVLDGELAVP